MAALGFAIDAAGLFASLKLSGAFDTPSPAEAKTNVQIILGSGERTSTAGGPAPHVALWDDGKFPAPFGFALGSTDWKPCLQMETASVSGTRERGTR